MKFRLLSAVLLAGAFTGLDNPLYAATASRHVIGLIGGHHGSSYGDTAFAYGNYFEHTFAHSENYSFGDAFASGNGVSGGSGLADIGFGWIRMNATVVSSSGANPDGISFQGIPHNNGGEADISFTGTFTDVLTIQNPLYTGQFSTIDASLLVDGTLSPRVDASLGAAGTATGQASGRFVHSFLANTFPDDLPIGVDDVDIGGRVGFVFGQPFTLTVELNLRARAASASNGGSAVTATFVHDFTHTLAWGGLADLRDVDGNAIDDYTVTSLSGTDYRLAILPPDTDLPTLPAFPPGTPWQCAPTCVALTPVPLPPAAISLAIALATLVGIGAHARRG